MLEAYQPTLGIFKIFIKCLTIKKINYKVSDFRGGDYQGDFVSYDFKEDKFNFIIFLSSLEHFPQCTESDVIYRDGEDTKRISKKPFLSCMIAANILLTVPFGKQKMATPITKTTTYKAY